MDKVSDITKTNIKEYIPTSCLTNSRDNNAKELEEFMSANNATWSNLITQKRNRWVLQIYTMWKSVKFTSA